MREFIVYPAIDLRSGKVVRLRQGMRDQQTEYNDSPELVAQEWISQGAKWLHVVNLNAAFGEETSENTAAICKILQAGKEKVKIQLGGGLRTMDQISAAFDLGVSRIVLGTAVVENPHFGEEVLKRFDGEKIAFGFDVLGQELMSRGWQANSGLSMAVLAKRLAESGAKLLIYTSIQNDGMRKGVDWVSSKQLADQTNLRVIASGGSANLMDIAQVRKVGLAGVIVGTALYEGNFTLKEAIDVR